MKFRNKILVMLLTMTLASQGLAWDDGKKKEEDNKRKYIIAGLVTVGVVVAGVVGVRAWKYFDVGSMLKKKSSVDAEEFIGIDLGTTKSGGGRGDELIADAEGRTMTASAVAYDKDGKVLSTGNEALGEDGVVTSAKRAMGTSYDRAKEDDTLKVVPDTTKGMEHMAVIKTAEGHSVRPEEAATEVLRGVKQRIDAHYGKDFKKAVITVPAYFYEFQKAATKQAAKAAGFDEVVLINEPTAAALAHGAAELDIKQLKKMKNGVNYLVYDFGGGTFDVSIVNVSFKKGKKTFTVKALDGDPRLGGDDIDKKIAEKFAQDLGLDFNEADESTKRVLRQKAEEAKIHLSNAKNTSYSKGFELSGQGDDVQVEISIDDFNTEIEEITQRTIDKTKNSLKLSGEKGVREDDIHEVVLVGGSSRNLLVRDELINMFGRDKLAKSLQGKVDPDEMVAKGAAKYAKSLDEQNKDYDLVDIVPIAFRVDMLNAAGEKTSVEVIERFITTPTAPMKISGEASGGDTLITIRQGDSDIPSENVLLGTIKVPSTAKDNIEISLEVKQDGTLEVIAKNTETGKELPPLIIDMSKTPKELEKVVEEGDQQLFQRSLLELEGRKVEVEKEKVEAIKNNTKAIECNTKAIECNTKAIEESHTSSK